MSDEWTKYKDGFTLRRIAVFPSHSGSWAVWTQVDGEWQEVEPRLSVASSGRHYVQGGRPPYQFWLRSMDETVREAQKLAIAWEAQQKFGVPMLTAEQWLCRIFGELGPTKEGAAEVIRQIQRDAIDAAARRVETYSKTDHAGDLPWWFDECAGKIAAHVREMKPQMTGAQNADQDNDGRDDKRNEGRA